MIQKYKKPLLRVFTAFLALAVVFILSLVILEFAYAAYAYNHALSTGQCQLLSFDGSSSISCTPEEALALSRQQCQFIRPLLCIAIGLILAIIAFGLLTIPKVRNWLLGR